MKRRIFALVATLVSCEAFNNLNQPRDMFGDYVISVRNESSELDNDISAKYSATDCPMIRFRFATICLLKVENSNLTVE